MKLWFSGGVYRDGRVVANARIAAGVHFRIIRETVPRIVRSEARLDNEIQNTRGHAVIADNFVEARLAIILGYEMWSNLDRNRRQRGQNSSTDISKMRRAKLAGARSALELSTGTVRRVAKVAVADQSMRHLNLVTERSGHLNFILFVLAVGL